MKQITIPADVPQETEKIFITNYEAITKGTSRLMLFTGDQKIEHLNQDFHGNSLPKEVNCPTHLFEIASKGYIGAFATQLGLITRYGKQYPNINYIAKLNSKTNIIPKDEKDPLSSQLWSVQDVIELKNNTNLNLCGIGYTVYLGSKYENQMLQQAAQCIYEAHKHGLITIVWMYPRGKHIHNEANHKLIAGAAGIANCLGADFAKINPPEGNNEQLKQITAAAGNTKLLCSGGEKKEKKVFLQQLYDQIHTGDTRGSATGRNIFQQSLDNAISFTKAISAIVYENKSVDEVITI